MELENVFTQGTEGIPIASDPKRSSINVPVNEDWQIIVEVLSIENGIVSGKKIWDDSDDFKYFYARLEYAGSQGTPPDTSVTVGQTVTFNRVGEFNSQGLEGYELREEDASKCSWVCLIESPDFLYVQDLGEGSGREVVFDENGNISTPTNSDTLPLKTLDPVSYFHDSKPPFAAGRVYAAQKIRDDEGVGQFYLVFLPAKGNSAKVFTQVADTIQFRLDVDGQGNVLDFQASTIG